MHATSVALSAVLAVPLAGMAVVPAQAQDGRDDRASNAAVDREPGATGEGLLERLTRQQTREGSGTETSAQTAALAAAEPFDALVFSRTTGFRHDSIPAGIAAIQDLGAEHGFTVTATEDAGAFTADNLTQYDVVVFLSTTGDVLNPAQQEAFEGYIQAGGGYAGIHAASDTEYAWPWYGELVGSYFAGHPQNQDATVKVNDQAHPSTAHLDATWDRYDEWYNFQGSPRDDVHVLAEMDETSYDAGAQAMGSDHPIAWCHDYDGGRSWYTGMGHTVESFSEPDFLEHLAGGLESAAGVVDADCAATQSDSFDKVVLDDGTSNPMDLDVAEDGRTFYLERNGELRVVAPAGGTTTAGTLDVTTVQEFGLVGIQLAPDFATSQQLYLYWSPDGSSSDRVSRFTMNGDTLDLASEEVILEVPVQRAQCCHMGGSLQFDTQGNLYIGIGDNTNPFASDGYTPIDERPGREAWDAQRTSGNTNDLRGKILRITPQADGTYTIPEGNLFAPGTADTLPEIFAMGFRNPFKIGIDPRSDTVLVGEYGPDAGGSNPNRAPDGRVEWNAVDEPGNYGWPYCVGANTPYNDCNFATSASGPLFDCDAPVNDSPNNTGLTDLPPVIEADVWYGYGTNPLFPEIGGGGAPMAGGVYVYDEALDSERKWPAYWDGKAIFGEWNQNKLYSFQVDGQTRAVSDINQILTGMTFKRPHAMRWGPDGALYIIEWGAGFGGNNADSGVYRIDYVQGNRAPIASLSAEPTSGPVPLPVQFDSAGSRDPDGTEVTIAWDFDGDGVTDSTEAAPLHTYTEPGDYTARLTVTDTEGTTAVATQEITAGNTAPTVTVEAPVNGGFFSFGDVIRYEVTVTDPEDGEIDCNDVIVQPALGHDEHAHPYDQYRGCEGEIPIPGDEGHVGADIFGVLTATYTDQGAPGVGELTTQEVVILQPKRKEAEYFSDTGRLEGSTSGGDPGVQIENTGDVQGGLQNIGFIETDDWWAFEPASLTGIDSVSLRAASEPGGGVVEIREGSVDGPAVGTLTVPATGGWQVYDDFATDISGATGASGPLYFVAITGGLNVNWVDFDGKGVSTNERPDVTASATPTAGTAPLDVAFDAEAIDPEGDTDLTYAWLFGDGGQASGAQVEHTYTEAGSYTARVSVTDSLGAVGTATVAIEVTDVVIPPSTCFDGRSDDFTGTVLDRDRWTTVIRENQDLNTAVADGSLTLETTTTDIYGTSAATTPNIVLQDLPDGAFTATTKVTMEARHAYQQAGLIIYGDDDNYAKIVQQGRNTAQASADDRIFQFIQEENGSPNEVADSNTPNLGAAFPDTYWVRFTSTDGSDLTASYSADGQSFTEMPQTKSLDGIVDPKVGVFALAGSGERPVADAAFDWFSITPDDSLEPKAPSDEFDGTSLDACRWNRSVRPDPSAYEVSDGSLRIDTGNGDIYGADNTSPSNFILQDAPDGDWTVETRLDGSAFDEQYQQAGLIAYGDDDHYVKLDLVTDNAAGTPVARRIELRSEVGGVVTNPQPQSPSTTDGVWFLRLTKSGEVFSGAHSADGETWTTLGESVTNADLGSAPAVGLFAFGAQQQASKTVSFDYFRVLGDEPPPGCELLAPEVSADGRQGTNGWWTGAVTLTAQLPEGSVDGATIERSIRGGAWAAYDTPVVIDREGITVVRFRASAGTQVSDVVRERVRIDSQAPSVQIGGIRQGQIYGDSESVTPFAARTDATSGVASVSATVDRQGVRLGRSMPLYVLALSTHRLRVVVVDEAGNRAVASRTFGVSTSFLDLRRILDRFRPRGYAPLDTLLRDAQRQQAGGQLAQARRSLAEFVRVATDRVPDQARREVLVRDARELRRRLAARTAADREEGIS